MTAAQTLPYWQNRVATPDDTDDILALVRAVHGDEHQELNAAYWNWRYLSNTPFRADILMSQSAGVPIGIQPAAIFDWQWGKRHLRGAMYTGVLTHPDHRRRGVFKSLIHSANDHAAARGAAFCMTLPNDASLPGFHRLGDWQFPGEIPLFLKVLDGPAAFRAKFGRLPAHLFGPLLRPAFRARPTPPEASDVGVQRVAGVPETLDDVFDEFARDVDCLMIRRSSAYWHWRYESRPSHDYRSFAAHRADRLVGAVATSTGSRAGLEMGMIMDVVACGGQPVVQRLIAAAEDDIRNRGLGIAVGQATSPLLKDALRARGFISSRLVRRAKRFHFTFRATGASDLPDSPARIDQWHLTFGDSDNA